MVSGNLDAGRVGIVSSVSHASDPDIGGAVSRYRRSRVPAHRNVCVPDLSGRLVILFRELAQDIRGSIRRGSTEVSNAYRMNARHIGESAERIVEADHRGALAFPHGDDEPLGPSLSPAHSRGSSDPPLRTGLGDDVDALVAMSRELLERTGRIQRRGWSIAYGERGEGTYASRRDRRIVIDRLQEGDPEYTVVSLAHEVGHAEDDNAGRRLPYRSGESRDEWVRRSVHESVRWEGEARLVEIQAIREIHDSGHSNILERFSGHDSFYDEIYDSYRRGFMSRDEARDEIGALYLEETMSTTRRTYGSFYSDHYARVWDEDHRVD